MFEIIFHCIKGDNYQYAPPKYHNVSLCKYMYMYLIENW